MKKIIIMIAAAFMSMNAMADQCSDLESASWAKACQSMTGPAKDKCMVDGARAAHVDQATIDKCSHHGGAPMPPPPAGQPPQGGQPNGNMMPPQNGGQPQRAGQHGGGMSPDECNKMIPKIQGEGQKCLRVVAANERKTCFDAIGKHIPKECDKPLEPIKRGFADQEKQKYPKDPSSFNH